MANTSNDSACPNEAGKALHLLDARKIAYT